MLRPTLWGPYICMMNMALVKRLEDGRFRSSHSTPTLYNFSINILLNQKSNLPLDSWCLAFYRAISLYFDVRIMIYITRVYQECPGLGVLRCRITLQGNNAMTLKSWEQHKSLNTCPN